MADRIIYNLDTNGYVQGSLEDLLGPDAGEDDLALAAQALALVQKLDPPGVAARDLRECLLLQLTPGMSYYEQLRTLISGHLEDLEHNRLPIVARHTGYSIEVIQQTIQELRKLNPKPGADFASAYVPLVIPDVFVEQAGVGRVSSVRLEDGRTPSLFISPYYRKLLASGTANDETREYIKRKINAAQWLIDSIEQRRSTLTRVAQAIVDHQKEFLSKGPEHIEPLKMQQIADKVGVHVTTVSRAVDDKWIQTPRGIFPLEAVLLRRHPHRGRRRDGLGRRAAEAPGDHRQRGPPTSFQRRRAGQGAGQARHQGGPADRDQVSQGDEYSQLAAAPRLERRGRGAGTVGGRRGRRDRLLTTLRNRAGNGQLAA